MCKPSSKSLNTIFFRTKDTGTVLVISEQSLLGLMAARLGAESVVHICEENHHIREYIHSCAVANSLQDRLSLESTDWLASADLSKVIIASDWLILSILTSHWPGVHSPGRASLHSLCPALAQPPLLVHPEPAGPPGVREDIPVQSENVLCPCPLHRPLEDPGTSERGGGIQDDTL